jgi:hypothetical protein
MGNSRIRKMSISFTMQMVKLSPNTQFIARLYCIWFATIFASYARGRISSVLWSFQHIFLTWGKIWQITELLWGSRFSWWWPWYGTPCGAVDVYRPFEGIYCLNLQPSNNNLKLVVVQSSEMWVNIYQTTRHNSLHMNWYFCAAISNIGRLTHVGSCDYMI